MSEARPSSRIDGDGYRPYQFRALPGIALMLLLAQFLLGMWLNLFVSFPTSLFSQPGIGSMMGTMMGFMVTGGMPILMVHMMLGFALLVVSILVLAFAMGSSAPGLVLISVLGLVSVLAAGLGGLGFMFSGFQNDLFSYLMAIGFISAFTTYFVALSFPGLEQIEAKFSR